MQRGAAIGAQTQLFSVPQVVSFSDGQLATRRVPNLVPLREALHRAKGRESVTLVATVGRCLAAIHTRLEPGEEEPSIGWQGSFAGPDVVAVHGDFGMTNVQVCADDSGVVILDWAAPAWAKKLGSRASSHWDLSLFLVDMNYQRPGDPRYIRRTHKLAREFLGAYWNERRMHPATQGLQGNLARMTVNYYRHAGTGLRRLARLPSSSLFLAAAPTLKTTK